MCWIDYFDRGWEINPHGPCLIDDAAEHGPTAHSYTEVRDLTLRIAGGLMDAGFERGQHGGVLGFIHPLSVAATLAMCAQLEWSIVR
ncbi:MAG: hypothetical protein ACI9BW_004370 [Gammaproteobacteria bacterium]|jgi:hypothetical protein